MNVLLEQATQQSKNLISNETFFVRDLFICYEWNRILRKNRLLLGTLFLNSYKQVKIIILMPSIKQAQVSNVIELNNFMSLGRKLWKK
jgi:hypothetical protein